MGYSNYKKLEQVTKKFGLATKRQRLFESVQPIKPSSWLVQTLEISEFFALRNEKAKSERIISPILTEIALLFKDKVSFFSGEDLPADSTQDLSGECDFFFTLVPQSPYLELPIISLVESKDDDMDYGTAQCAAQLYGAKLFNERDGANIPVLYGCATDGVRWQFLRFEKNTFYIDTKVYTDLQEILGVWCHIIQLYIK
jgi:hypothetical protein